MFTTTPGTVKAKVVMSPPGFGKFSNCCVVKVVVRLALCVSINCALFALTVTVCLLPVGETVKFDTDC